MTKISNKLLRVISLSTGVIAILLGLVVFSHYQPQDRLLALTTTPPSDPFLDITPVTLEPAQTFSAILPVDSSAIRAKIRKPTPIQPSPTPTIPWMEFNGVSILDLPTSMTFRPGCEEKPFSLPSFKILPWTPDVFEKGYFDISRGNAIAWDHLNYTGLWIHSGFDWSGNPLAAYPLENYLETKDGWRKRTPEEFDQNAANCLIGSEVSVQVGEALLKAKVTAVIRIPPGDVETVSNHVMDMVPYLAKTYPESGFDQLKAPQLLLYFCGRQLATEAANPSVGASLQSRIIVAIDFGS